MEMTQKHKNIIKNGFYRKCKFKDCKDLFNPNLSWNKKHQISFCRKHYLKVDRVPSLKERILKEMVIKDSF